MEQYQDYQAVTDKAKELFPEESYKKTLALLEKLRTMVPLGENHKINYLETLISYVDGIINGDEIIQCTTKEYSTKYAIEALKEIVLEVHENTLDIYREQRAKLQSEITALSTQHELLNSQVDALEKRKSELVDQTVTLNTELSNLQKELGELKRSGLSKVNEEVEQRRQQLIAEIEELERTKQNLNSIINDLKNLINTHTSTITKLGGTEEVTWEPITSDDPIYNTNSDTIESYIFSLKINYMDKTGCTKDECEREFDKHCPGLIEFINTLKKFNNTIEATPSLKSIINYQNWNSIVGSHNANKLAAYLKNFRMPKFQPKISNIDLLSIKLDTIPTSTDSMLRELYFQRIAIEALTKQKIAEAELKSVIAIMKAALPENFDYSNLLQTFNGFNSILQNELAPSESQLKLITDISHL